jgi:hypothetical protein
MPAKPAVTHCCQRFTYKPKVKAISSEVAFLFLVAHKAVCNAQRVLLPSLLRQLIVHHQNGNRGINKLPGAILNSFSWPAG